MDKVSVKLAFSILAAAAERAGADRIRVDK